MLYLLLFVYNTYNYIVIINVNIIFTMFEIRNMYLYDIDTYCNAKDIKSVYCFTM